MTTETATEQQTDAGLPVGPDKAPRRLPDHFVAPWASQALVRLTGPDVDRFLQGQTTCNLDELTAGKSLLGSFCTLKGRVLSSFRLIRDGEDVLMRLPAALAEELIDHLARYRMFFKAEMAPDPGWAILGLAGDDALQSLGLEAARPDEAGQVCPAGDGYLIRTLATAEGQPRCEWWLPTTAIRDAGLSEAALRQPAACWQLSEVRAGLASLNPESRDAFLPQMLNLHAIGGISFNKGCYTGQEVIARMHYRGQLKKSLCRFSLADAVAAPGEALVDETGRNQGQVVNRVALEDGGCELLAVVNHAALAGTLHREADPAATLDREPLPYKVPDQPETA